MSNLESNISMDLIKWDSAEDALAPLSKQQKSIILRLEEATSQSTNNQDNQESSTSENYSAVDRVETCRELLRCYASLEAKYDLTECFRHSRYLEQLKTRTEECHNLCAHIETALDDFTALSKQYAIVSGKTTSLHDATEQLISEQEKLTDMCNDIACYVKYFKEVDFIMEKLEMPNLSIRSDLFLELTEKIEENINFMERNNTFKESMAYLVKYRHCQSKAITMMQHWINDSLEQATESILNPTGFKNSYMKDPETTKAFESADTALALFYGRFQSILPKIKPTIDIIERRSVNRQEYETLLSECQQHYLMKRGSVLVTSVRKGLLSIKDSYKGDHCSLVRQACALLLHASIDEYRLFYQFFSIKSPALSGYLEGLCNALYDALRPSIIHINHLETLAEICCILRIEMIEEHVQNNLECLEGFGNVCLQLLHDAQERLVFRAHLYLQSDVLGYNPSPGDLAYPDKLRMMEDIAETLREETRQAKIKKISVSSVSSLLEDHQDDNVGTEAMRNNHIGFEPIYAKSGTTNSPADLHGMWYPTVRRTLVCLSRLYRCVDRPVFQSLSREAITYCVDSIEIAKDKIELRASELDAELFQIKHLLILREQIAPFQVDFTVKEYSLDFSKVKTAAFGLLEKRSRLFALSNNALLEFFLEGAPRMKEHLVDSRKHVDVKLKLSCQRFIQHATMLLVESIITYLEKSKIRSVVNNANSTASNANYDELGDPQKVAAMISEAQRMIKFRLPNIQQSMQLYLANRETECILFRPIRNNVVAAFSQFFQLLQNTFTAEQQLLIGCPLPEQISVMLSSTSLVHARTVSEQSLKATTNPETVKVEDTSNNVTPSTGFAHVIDV